MYALYEVINFSWVINFMLLIFIIAYFIPSYFLIIITTFTKIIYRIENIYLSIENLLIVPV